MNLPKKIEHELRNFTTKLSKAVDKIQEECNAQDQRISDIEKKLEKFDKLADLVSVLAQKVDIQEKKIAELDRAVRSLCDQHI